MASSAQITTALEEIKSSLASSNTSQFDSIEFDWNAMHFSASSTDLGTNGGIINLSSTIGRLYFTVENKILRNESIKQIFQNNGNIGCNYKLENDGSVTFTSTTTLKEKVSSNDFVKALTVIMLESGVDLKKLRGYLKAA